jgi:hypothetical protein
LDGADRSLDVVAHLFSFEGYLLASLTLWPAERIGQERYGPSAELAYGLIDPAMMKLYGLRPKLKQIALNAIDILRVMSKEVATESEFV